MMTESTSSSTGFVTSPKIGGSWKSSGPGASKPGLGAVAKVVTQRSFRFRRSGVPRTGEIVTIRT